MNVIKSSKSVAVGLLAVSVFRELGSPALCNVAHGLLYPARISFIVKFWLVDSSTGPYL